MRSGDNYLDMHRRKPSATGRWPNAAPRRARSSGTARSRARARAKYRFNVDGAIRTILISEDLRKQLSSGALVDGRYALLPRAAGEKVRERDAAVIVIDHGQPGDSVAQGSNPEDDACYTQFVVPDDLIW